jgi:hypothetical protein
MMELQKVIMILRDYEADQRDGFVSNLDSYIENRCIVLGIIGFKSSIINIIERANKNIVCKVLT